MDFVRLPNSMKKSVVAGQLVEQHVEVIEQVTKNLEASNAKYKATADTLRHHKKFWVDDIVMVFLRKEHGGSQKKPDQKKYEPFKILQKINNNAYVLIFVCIWRFSKRLMLQIFMSMFQKRMSLCILMKTQGRIVLKWKGWC